MTNQVENLNQQLQNLFKTQNQNSSEETKSLRKEDFIPRSQSDLYSSEKFLRCQFNPLEYASPICQEISQSKKKFSVQFEFQCEKINFKDLKRRKIEEKLQTSNKINQQEQEKVDQSWLQKPVTKLVDLTAILAKEHSDEIFICMMFIAIILSFIFKNVLILQ